MSVAGEEKKQSIAFIGTGLMGGPMARRLLGAGFAVKVWNRSVEKAEALVADGAVVAASPAEAARGADVVITMLSDGKAVGEVLFETGVAEALEKGAVVIDSSSIAPPIAREHASRLEALGIRHIDAPVSGGVPGATAGTLAIMAGGDEAVVSSCRSLCTDGTLDLCRPFGCRAALQTCQSADRRHHHWRRC